MRAGTRILSFDYSPRRPYIILMVAVTTIRSVLRPPLWVLIMCTHLGACASFQNTSTSEWPEGIPPASYFVSLYEKDTENHVHQSLDEYLYWVRKFYDGTALYPQGWSDIMADLRADTEDPEGDPEKARAREERMFRLGRDIAAEWSKDNSVNRVDNQHLAIWSVAAERAVGAGTIDETLDKIRQDLQKLMSLELEPDAITADRYHPRDPNDWFAI